MSQLNLSSLFYVQNILALIRHHTVITQNEQIFKAEVANWEKAFQNATSLSEAESSKQANHIDRLEKSVCELRTTKITAEGEAKKEKLSAEDAK